MMNRGRNARQFDGGSYGGRSYTSGASFNYSNFGNGRGSSFRCFLCGEAHRKEECTKPRHFAKEGEEYVRVTLTKKQWEKIEVWIEDERLREKLRKEEEEKEKMNRMRMEIEMEKRQRETD